eukprot:c23435_g2_i1 orf=285-1322(-)
MEDAPTCCSTGQPVLPPGFRFHPTDEELVVHYLKKKAASCPLPVPIIAEVDLYKFDPWDLPAKSNFGEHEWYFFSPRDRKYPNGARPNRAAASGYWKATGTDKPILTCGGTQQVGVKKALVFYRGRPPKGLKTNWIMHEYRLTETAVKPISFAARKSLRLDDWVLCRIYKKSNHASTLSPRLTAQDSQDTSCVEEVLASLPDISDSKSNILPRLGSFTGLLGEVDPCVSTSMGDANNPEFNTTNSLNVFQGDSSISSRMLGAESINQIDPTFIVRNTSIPYTTWIVPKSEMEDTSDLMKREPFRMMNLPNLIDKIPFQLQKSESSHGDLESRLRFPFGDGKVRFY